MKMHKFLKTMWCSLFKQNKALLVITWEYVKLFWDAIASDKAT